MKKVIANYHFTILIGGEYNPWRKSRTNATDKEKDEEGDWDGDDNNY